MSGDRDSRGTPRPGGVGRHESMMDLLWTALYAWGGKPWRSSPFMTSRWPEQLRRSPACRGAPAPRSCRSQPKARQASQARLSCAAHASTGGRAGRESARHIIARLGHPLPHQVGNATTSRKTRFWRNIYFYRGGAFEVLSSLGTSQDFD